MSIIHKIVENLEIEKEPEIDEALSWKTASVSWYGGPNRGDKNGFKDSDTSVSDGLSLHVISDVDGYILIGMIEDPNGKFYQLESDAYKTPDEAKKKAEEVARKYKKGITAKDYKSACSSIFKYMDDGTD